MRNLLLFTFIFLFSLLLAPNISAQNESLYQISFDSQISYQDLKNMLVDEGGSVLVFWPGNAYVLAPMDHSFSLLQQRAFISELNAVDSEQLHLQNVGEYTDFQGSCQPNELDEDIASARNKGTSDKFEGHSVCALFFLNHAANTNQWIIRDQDDILANTALNLLWWVEQAALYNIEASFEIKPYFFDDPVCQISSDPTILTNSQWTSEVLNALGYTTGNNLERQTNYVKDLIEDFNADWGFMAYILRGNTSYRSNANIFGPSTRIYYLAARSGYVTAHEVGHIYGLQDEYEERAPFAYKYVLNGMQNLNCDFRNPVNGPCIMKMSSAHAGVCAYNAVQLEWSDSLSMLEVNTVPEDAIYKVEFLTQTGGIFLTGRNFMGKEVFPMGRGTKIRLNGLSEISIQSGVYSNPLWSNGQDRIELTMESEPIEEVVDYQFIAPSNQYTAYLRHGQDHVGKRFNQLFFDENRFYALSDQAISVSENNTLQVLDKIRMERPDMPDTTYRLSNSVFKTWDGSLVLAGREGTTRAEVVIMKDGIEENAFIPPINFREIGAYLAAVLLDDGRVIAAFETGNLHIYQDDGSMQIFTESDGLPMSQVSTLSMDKDGIVWIGYAKDRSGAGTGAVYLLNPQTMEFFQDPTMPIEVRTAEIHKIKTYNQGHKLILISTNRFYVFENGIWETIFLPVTGLFDVDPIEDDRYVAGTSNGMYYHDLNGEWIHCTTTSHNLQENICRAVTSLPNDIILAGHHTTGITALYTGEQSVSISDSDLKLSTKLVFYPNPYSSGQLFVEFDGPANDVFHVDLIDLSGKVIHSTAAMRQSDRLFSFDVPASVPGGIYLISLRGSVHGSAGLIRIDR